MKTSWRPIPALKITDADIIILFLSANWVRFSSEVQDPWYLAHRKVEPAIYADEASSPIACKIQQQFCYPDLSGASRCERFAGMYDDSAAFEYKERQKATYVWTSTVMSQLHDVYNIASVLGASALASKFQMMGSIQGPIPDNQWQIDLEYMHNITLANLQSAAVTIARGPSNPTLLKYVSPPSDSESRNLCRNQVSSGIRNLTCPYTYTSDPYNTESLLPQLFQLFLLLARIHSFARHRHHSTLVYPRAPRALASTPLASLRSPRLLRAPRMDHQRNIAATEARA